MLKFDGIQIIPTVFPDQTSQIWKLDAGSIVHCVDEDLATIEWEFESEAEVFWICQWAQLMKKYGVKDIHVNAPFLPYGRQDKKVANALTFSLNTLFTVLGSCGVNKVITLDAHSNEANGTAGVLLNSQAPYDEIGAALSDFKPDRICWPDGSAGKRYSNMLIHLQTDWRAKKNHVEIEKVRDQLTGELKDMKLKNSANSKTFKGEKIMMIDDLCDAGGTFKWAASILKDHGAKEVALYTTHGLYTKGKQTLYDAGISCLYNRHGLEKNIDVEG